jgi:hypothetical protein
MSLPFSQSLRFGAVHAALLHNKPYLRITGTEIQRLKPPAGTFDSIYMLPAGQQTLLLMLGSSFDNSLSKVHLAV